MMQGANTNEIDGLRANATNLECPLKDKCGHWPVNNLKVCTLGAFEKNIISWSLVLSIRSAFSG
jgi:hypothetical protein